MTSDLTFLTNKSGKTLRERFSDILRENTCYFDCLVGYFFISGIYKIYPALEKVGKIRILIGLRTDCPAYDLLQEAKGQSEFQFQSHAAVIKCVREILTVPGLESEIGDLVYNLYGLTKDEVLLVEGKT